MRKVKLKGEDWMMTDADTKRFCDCVIPVLEKYGIGERVVIDIAIEETWEMFVCIPTDLFSWPTIRKRMKLVCEELGFEPKPILSDCDRDMHINFGDQELYHRFCITNMFAPKDHLERYEDYFERMQAGKPEPPPPPEPFSEPWRHGHHEDTDGTVYDEGVILPKQDLNAPDTAVVSLPLEFLDDHREANGFGELRDYTPYYAKKFLTRPIRRVKILYGHQVRGSVKNKWAIWKLDKLEVELGRGEIYTSPYRDDGTLKKRVDYGTDLPIVQFHLSGHELLQAQF